MSFIISKALHRIMPLGGWSYDGETVTVHEDGVAHGYIAPTQGQIDVEVAKLEITEPALQEIKRLEALITSRRLREALLTQAGKDWLTNQDALIATERAKLLV